MRIAIGRWGEKMRKAGRNASLGRGIERTRSQTGAWEAEAFRSLLPLPALCVLQSHPWRSQAEVNREVLGGPGEPQLM